MEESRRGTTVRQLELMVQFLEHHRELALGRVRSKEAREVAARLWRECAETLNAEGPAQTAEEWSKVWNDYKCRVRILVGINANQRASGGGPSNVPALTPIDEKIANILGRDVGPLADGRQDQFASNDGDDTVVVEVVDEQPLNLQAEASSTMLLNMNEGDQSQYVLSAEQGVQAGEHMQLPASSVPSVTGQVPPLQNTPRRTAESVRRVLKPRRRRRILRPTRETTQTTRTALEESRAMILLIEEMWLQAELRRAEALYSISKSVRLIAESIDRFSKKYCQQQSNPQP